MQVVQSLGRLVENAVAAGSGAERFTTATISAESLVVGFRDADGREANYRVTVELVTPEEGCCGVEAACPVTDVVTLPAETQAAADVVAAP